MSFVVLFFVVRRIWKGKPGALGGCWWYLSVLYVGLMALSLLVGLVAGSV